jgi:type 1 glutamine amidotransferase
MIRSLIPMLLAAGLAFGQAQPAPTTAKKIQVLIVTGNQVSHDWRATTAELRKMIEDSGKFEVRVTEEFRGATADTLKPYDVVLVNYAARKPEHRWPAPTEQALVDFVRSGKGIVVYHFTLSAFDGWEDYERMVTGTWRPGNGQHSPRHDFEVTVLDKQHPIVQGLGDSFPIADDELYANLRTVEPEQRRVLAAAYDDPQFYKDTSRILPPEKRDSPMLWTRQWGKGRVFVTALGHDVKALQNPGFRTTLVRGLEWAAGTAAVGATD